MQPMERDPKSTPSQNTQWVLEALRENARSESGGWVGFATRALRDQPQADVEAFVTRGVREACEDAGSTLQEVRQAAREEKPCTHSAGEQLFALALTRSYPSKVNWGEVGFYIMESARDWVGAELAKVLTHENLQPYDLAARTGYPLDLVEVLVDRLKERGLVKETDSQTLRLA